VPGREQPGGGRQACRPILVAPGDVHINDLRHVLVLLVQFFRRRTPYAEVFHEGRHADKQRLIG
jgi:hypothetical protein